MYRLTMNFAGKSVRKFNFDQEAVCIGRDPECEILIDNIGVSRRHATIERANGEYILTDLKSHNGTFVRGQRIYHHQLTDGDEFFIGKYSLHFENLEIASEARSAQAEERPSSLGLQDMTFRLDKAEVERIMGTSTTGNVPKLALIAPERVQQTFKLEGPYYVVGRDKSSTIRLKKLLMPRFAAVFVRDERSFHVLSLSRLLPVKVNGRKITEHQLADGDMVQLGKFKFRFAIS